MIGPYPGGGAGLGGVHIAAASVEQVSVELAAETYPDWQGTSANAARKRKDEATRLAALAVQSIADAQVAIQRYYEAFGQETLRAANPLEHAKNLWETVEPVVDDMVDRPLPVGHPVITPGIGGYPFGPPLISGPAAPGSPGWGNMPQSGGGGGQP